MKRRKPHIQPRIPFFLGVEGASELGYGALLSRLAGDSALHVHLDVRLLQPGAGDPVALVRKALQVIREQERKRVAYRVKAILMDAGSAVQTNQAMALAAAGGIQHVIWQNPDHEAVLLRHLENCRDRRPPAGASMAALLREWPGYRKGMIAQQLAQRVNAQGVEQACAVEPGLAAFLREVGFAV